MGIEKYLVNIERNGKMTPIGYIAGESYKTARFAYFEHYLQDRNAVPVSISLPLQQESFSAERTKLFFEGLLPEGFTRRSVAQWLHLDENDYLSILHQLGRECLGAICILTEDETKMASYEKITEQQVRDFDPGNMPVITAGSSLAAEMLAEAAPEIRKMGFGLDLESNAANIPVMDLPNGLDGPVKMSQKKVYPNDPCPCGSGKKFKKCCGKTMR